MQSDVTLASIEESASLISSLSIGCNGEEIANHGEQIDYTSFDGKRIQGWIQKPSDFDPQKKYPLILNIHGGPHAAYGRVFDHEFQ